MSAQLPGERIHRWLEHHVDEATRRRLVDPTIADLQHEVQLAGGSRWRRSVALARGYGALARVLTLNGLDWRMPMRRVLTVLLLSLCGAAYMTWARKASGDAKVVNSAPLLLMFATPIALRAVLGVASYRRTFVSGIVTGLLMYVLVNAFAGALTSLLFRWMGTAVVAGFVVVLSALGAVAVSKPPAGVHSLVRDVVLSVFFGGLTTAVIFGGAFAWPHGTLPGTIAATAPFMVFLFGMLLTVTSLPLLLVVRRWIGGRWSLALVGAALSPAAIALSSYVDSGGTGMVDELQSMPLMAVRFITPFVAGSAVVGWCLAGRRNRSIDAVQPPEASLTS